jgi:hypothetical protein
MIFSENRYPLFGIMLYWSAFSSWRLLIFERPSMPRGLGPPVQGLLCRAAARLVFCPGNSLTKSDEFLEDGVSCSGPDEGL